MSIAASLLTEFNHEAENTRKLLAVIPEQQASWKPHTKSMDLGSLALHVAGLTGWVDTVLGGTELDLAAGSRPSFTTTANLLATFDSAVTRAQAALAAVKDEDLQVPWTLRAGDHVIFTLPRGAVLRSFVLSHSIHHRGQLTVYLRMLDVKFPGVYGPSADER